MKKFTGEMKINTGEMKTITGEMKKISCVFFSKTRRTKKNSRLLNG
jgi:hypothetical protein